MRNRFVVLFVCVTSAVSVAVLAQEKKEEPDAGTLKIDKVCTVGLPAKGFRWGEVRKIREIDGSSCICEKEGSTSRVTLTIEGRTRKLDGERSGGIKGHYNGLITPLKEAGFKILKTTRPELKSPISDTLEFSVSGQDPKGKPFFVRSVTHFRRQTYLFQAFAETEEEALQLAKVNETLKETSP